MFRFAQLLILGSLALVLITPSQAEAGLLSRHRQTPVYRGEWVSCTNGHHGRLGATTGADAADPLWTAQGLSFDGGDFVECDNAGISGGAARTVLAVVKAGPSGTFGVEWPGAGPLFQRWTLRDKDGKIRLEVAGAGHSTGFDVTR